MPRSQTTKRGRGRPAADPENPRNQRVYVFLSVAELETVDADRHDGESRGAVIHRWIRRRLKST